MRKRFHLIERDESAFFCKQDLFQLHSVAGSVAHTLTQNVAAVVHRDAHPHLANVVQGNLLVLFQLADAPFRHR